MKAIYKNEVSTYFTTLIGYIVVAFTVLFAGIFTSYTNLKFLSTRFEYVMSNMSIVFLIVVPILTMRTFSEERKQKTESLLYASPVTTTEIVLGKYFALLTVTAIPLLMICIIPLILRMFGNVYLPAAYISIGGFFILGAALLAIGMFISSLTDIQILAAGLTFVLLLANYFMGTLAPYINTEAYVSLIAVIVAAVLLGVVIALVLKNWIPGVIVGALGVIAAVVVYIIRPITYTNILMQFMGSIALFDRYSSVMYTSLDLSDMLFLVSTAVVFVFLTVQSLEKRRWS